MSAADPQNLNPPVSTPAAQSAPAQMSSDPMAAFKDLQMPDPVSWWPLAWGWWVLIALFLIVLIASGIYFYHRQQKLKAKKQAIHLIKNLPEGSSAIALNTLLKQAFLSYYPRICIASLSGKAWFDFLSAQLKTDEPAVASHLESFCLNLYQPDKTITNQDKQMIINYLSKVLPANASTRKSSEPQHV